MIPSKEPSSFSPTSFFFFFWTGPFGKLLPVRQPQGLGQGSGLCMWHLTMSPRCDAYGEQRDWYVHLFCLECKCGFVCFSKNSKLCLLSPELTFSLQPSYFCLLFSSLNNQFSKKPNPSAPFNWLPSVAGFVLSFVIHIVAAWVGFVITAVNIAW